MRQSSQSRRHSNTYPLQRLVCACVLCLPVIGLSQSPVLPATAVTIPAPSDKQKSKAANAYLAGARALDHRDYPSAEKQFARALVLNPTNSDYLTALALTREHHVSDLVQQTGRERLLGHNSHAESLLSQARLLDPKNIIVTEHDNAPQRPVDPWLASGPRLAGAIVLTPTPGIKSFHLHADTQSVLRSVYSGYGIRAIFDDSVTGQSLHFDLEDVPYDRTVPLLMRMTHVFAVPLDPTSVLIARDTPENRQRLERQMEETIYVPDMTAEQMTDLGTLVRNIFDIKQATVQSGLGILTIRAPEETLNAVNLILADLLDSSSEVMIELKLYSVAITRGNTTGFSAPQQIGAYNVASAAQSLVTANQTVVNEAIAEGLISSTASVLQIAEYLIGAGVSSTLLSSTLGIFGGGITTTGVYASSGVTLNFGLNTSDSRSIDDIQLRVKDRQPADFRVGSRYPITTSTYSISSAALSSLAGVSINGVSAASLLAAYTGSGTTTVVPQIQYEDLGLSLKATPTVMKTGNVNMKLDLKIEALAGGTIDNIPILNNRQFVSDITVGDGQTALLVSNLNRSEARSLNGVPGLSELPGFQSATDQTVEADSSQLVLLLTPHIIRRRPDTVIGPQIPFSVAKTAATQ